MSGLVLAGMFLVMMAGSCEVLRAEVCNIKLVTDASPDYTDMDSMIRSMTAKWDDTKDKCYAMFFWNHIGRRQTSPMILHGTELSDPIRQFNDYGFTMCSTVSGVNCSMWDQLGLKAKFWDLHNHTVAECYYDGAWHMYDNSMSALYTTCDGTRLAGVFEIGSTEGACELSGGKKEMGHIAKYHCLTAGSPDGFLTGADCARSLAEEQHTFSPFAQYQYYYYNWDRGHRYILNLQDGQTYTRYYHLGEKSAAEAPKYYVPNEGKDPEAVNTRYHIRGNGVWTFKPALTAGFEKVAYSSTSMAAGAGGLVPAQAGAAEVIFKVQGANVITSQRLAAGLSLKGEKDTAAISVSITNGMKWTPVWKSDKSGDVQAQVDLLKEVNGAYEVLVKIELNASVTAADAVLKSLQIDTVTEVNSKTQPKLNLGKNTVYVGAGEQTESIVLWPELQGNKYKEMLVEEKNISCDAHNGSWYGTIFATKAKEESYLVYRIDAPNDITSLTFGGRFYNRAWGSHTELLYSLDAGSTWTKSWSLTDTKAPWDTIHYETVAIPAGHKSVLMKYAFATNVPDDTGHGCSIYAIRMEANYKPLDTTFKPFAVTYTWKEVQKDLSQVERSHTKIVDKVPATYEINVGGADLPVMESLKISSNVDAKAGYSDGKDAGGEKFAYRWLTVGKNLALGKTYTCSAPPDKGTDASGKQLTDGKVGSNYAGGPITGWGARWGEDHKPNIDVDLGDQQQVGAFRIHMAGFWPSWDAMQNQWKDKVEVFTSEDGKEFTSRGQFDFLLRRKDIPANYMLADDERAEGYNFDLSLDKPIKARYVRYALTPARQVVVTEVQVFDHITCAKWDPKITLPSDNVVMKLNPKDAKENVVEPAK
jgi:hypothetical protein